MLSCAAFQGVGSRSRGIGLGFQGRGSAIKGGSVNGSSFMLVSCHMWMQPLHLGPELLRLHSMVNGIWHRTRVEFMELGAASVPQSSAAQPAFKVSDAQTGSLFLGLGV